MVASGVPRAVRVRDVIAENERTTTFRLDASVDADPGQFGMLWLPGLDEKPFSLLDADPLSFTIAAVGPMSRTLHRVPPGGLLWFRGPFGRGFTIRGADHVLVGGGYGVAPMLFLARRIVAGGGRVRAVIGAATHRELVLVDAFETLNGDVRLTTEDGSRGTRGLVTDVVRPMLASEPPDTLYACGPHGMLAALSHLAADHRVPAQLSWEAYMRCGVGICGSCEHEGMLLCADGPVLHHDPPP
jgi:dihydroorotate dehydrogenase electron transfer subunit